MELEVGQSNDVLVPESEANGIDDFGLEHETEGREDTRGLDEIDLNFGGEETEDGEFNLESELQNFGFELNDGGDEIVNQFFEENGIETPEAKRAAILAYTATLKNQEQPEHLDSELEQQAELEANQIIEQEYSKLNQEEVQDVANVIDYLEKTATPDQIPAIENMMKTAEGYRFIRNAMYEQARGNMPNTHQEDYSSKKPFTMDEYQEYSDKINAEAQKMNFAKVETLKKEMKKAILTRGSKELRNDLSHFLNN